MGEDANGTIPYLQTNKCFAMLENVAVSYPKPWFHWMLSICCSWYGHLARELLMSSAHSIDWYQNALGSLMTPWHGKDRDAQTTWRSQDQIPEAGLFPWQQGLKRAGSQREQSVLAQAQPISPSWEREAAQLSQFRAEKESANTSQVGQERRAAASQGLK